MDTKSLKNEVAGWAKTDKKNGAHANFDGSIPEITAEMIGRKVASLNLDERTADALRVELMGIWTQIVEAK